eukprot:771330-Rhodomonas_salina.4
MGHVLCLLCTCISCNQTLRLGIAMAGPLRILCGGLGLRSRGAGDPTASVGHSEFRQLSRTLVTHSIYY